MTLIVSSLSITNVFAYEIGVYTFCKDVDTSTDYYKPVHPTNVFEDTDKRVNFMIVFYHVEKPHQIIVKWIQPNGTIATTVEGAFDDPKSAGYEVWNYYTYYSYLDLQGKHPIPGQWKLEIYIDNKLELSEGFEIRSTAPTPTPTQTITVTATTTITPATQEIQKTKTDTGYLNLLYLTIAILTSALAALGLRLVKKRKISPQEQNVARTRAISPQEQNVTRYCSYCGKDNRPNVSYCTSCGKSMNE
jgi:hypothetical protein